MRTILISITQAVAAKNILRTGIIAGLLAHRDVRVVCLVRTSERAEYYRKEIPHERISYVVFYRAPSGALERLFSILKFHLIRTRTTDLKRRMRREETGNSFAYWVGVIVNRIIARRSVRALVRFFDGRFIGDPGFGAILEKHKPDAVVLPHLFDDVEIALLRESRRREITTVGFINSWDKLTGRASIRLLPDSLIVFNDIVKAEAVGHADMPADKISVCGIPQYDHYVTGAPSSRETFCREHHLDPGRPIVLFAPMGSAFSDSDWEVIDLLRSMIGPGTLLPDAQLFVRFQPNDFFDEREIAKRPWLMYDYPGIRYGTERGGDWDMNFEELAVLKDTLAHTALLVCYASSMSVDAAVFDKPVINIDFEVKPARRLKESPTQFYQMEHYRNALNSGGIRMVQNKAELADWIRRYLADPSLDREGRRRLIREQCGALDGKAGERIATTILAASGVAHRS